MSTTLRNMSPNDLANLITISSAALGTVLLVLFKSRCRNISICWGLWSCAREVQDGDDSEGDDDHAEDKAQLPNP
jgi:hypothetical protein